MSWDFDFENDSSLISSGFNDCDNIFFQSDSFENINTSALAQEQIETKKETFLPIITQEPSQLLLEENNQLREYVASLKNKAEQVSQVNTQLKGQLEQCRSWFKNAMFSGINTTKKLF